MSFLTLSNTDIKFAQKKLTQKFYTTAKALSTTKYFEIIEKKEFAKATLDKHVKTFIVHITSLLTMAIHLAREAQIASLVAEKLKIPNKYSDFLDVFLEKKALILLKTTMLNQHAIELQKSQQLPYGPIYSLGPVELTTLKIYIETNFANDFI